MPKTGLNFEQFWFFFLLRVVIMPKQEIFGANFNTWVAHRHSSAGSLGRRDCFAAAEFSFFLFACVYLYPDWILNLEPFNYQVWCPNHLADTH